MPIRIPRVLRFTLLRYLGYLLWSFVRSGFHRSKQSKRREAPGPVAVISVFSVASRYPPIRGSISNGCNPGVLPVVPGSLTVLVEGTAEHAEAKQGLPDHRPTGQKT